jgi:hypothetical protein
MDTNDRGISQKNKPKQQQEEEKQSAWKPPVFSEPDNPPAHQGATTGEPVEDEEKPTRQMTGGPDKPTA